MHLPEPQLRASAQDRHQQSLLSWQYPESPMEQPVRAALRASSAGEALLADRDDSWVASFQSLIQLLRAGSCDMFYYVSPQVCPMLCTKGIHPFFLSSCCAVKGVAVIHPLPRYYIPGTPCVR